MQVANKTSRSEAQLNTPRLGIRNFSSSHGFAGEMHRSLSLPASVVSAVKVLANLALRPDCKPLPAKRLPAQAVKDYCGYECQIPRQNRNQKHERSEDLSCFSPLDAEKGYL